MPRARKAPKQPGANVGNPKPGTLVAAPACAMVYHDTAGWIPAEQGQTMPAMDPRYLPPLWEMRHDDAGTPYFLSHEFQLSTYVDPRLTGA